MRGSSWQGVSGQSDRSVPPRQRRPLPWYAAAPFVLLASFFLLVGLAEAVPRSIHGISASSAHVAGSALGASAGILFDPPAPPAPSDAEPPYPLNHTLDGETTALGSVQNADFETEPGGVGSPPANADLEAAPVDVAVPTNGDFETGDFTGWTLNGSPTIQSDATHGYWARMGSNGQFLTSSALTIPQTAQLLVLDVYFQSSSSWIEVYVLSGPTYETSTLMASSRCANCGWLPMHVDMSSFRDQSIKLKFRARFAPVGIDAVKVQQVFPGYDGAGEYGPRSSGSDQWVILAGGAYLVTDPFTLDETAQFATVELVRNASNSQYNVAISTGPSFDTWTTLSYGIAPATWTVLSLNIAAYAGQQVKVRVKSTYNWVHFDDVFASQTADIPGWTPAGTTTRITEGSNHYVSTNGWLRSAATVLPADVQNVSFRLRSAATSSAVHVELLTGQDFSTVIELDYLLVSSTWTTLSYGLSPYAGQTVKLRLRAHTTGNTFHLDDAGLFEQVLPGWSMTTTGAVTTGEDALGTYAKGFGSDGAMFIRSSWISPGIIDRPNKVDKRLYALSYDLSANNLLQVFWVDEGGGSSTAFQDASGTDTAFETNYFEVYDFMGSRGRFVIKITGGGKAYSIGDNVARQSLSEPFSRKVGMGIDTVTGSVAFADQDLAVPGSMPLSFTRYYNSHSDRLGPLGFRWSHTYDTRLVFAEDDVGVVFGSGREEFFAPGAGGSYVAVDVRVHSTLVENGNGTFTLTTKDNLDYDFDAQGVLTQISDLNDNQVTLVYDAQGRLSTITGEGGTSLTLGYDGGGRLTSLTDPAGSVYAFGYDASSDLLTATDPEDGVRSYTYSRHRLSTVTDEEGSLVVSNAYDEVNRLTSQTDPEALSIEVAYETPAKGATEVTYPDQGVAAFYFDIHHRTTHTVDPTGRVTVFIYDGDGNLDKVIDSGANEWDYVFDPQGDLTEASDPLGNPASFTYNAKHLPLTVTDARGNTTTFTYDADGNMNSMTDPLDGVTTNTYDASGNLLTTTDPLDRTTTYTYNAKGLQTSRTDPLGNTWTSTYTQLGRLATETDPLGNTSIYNYDLLGRLVGIMDPLGRETTFLYDLVGHLLMVEDAFGNQTTWDYDERGLVEAKIDPAGKTTTYTYDENRRMTSLTNPAGETTSYSYDEAGRLVAITDPLGNESTYAHDAEGRLALGTDPLGRQTAYAYDDAGHLSEATLPNGATVGYAYDPDGNLTSLTDELDRVTTSTYDELSRLASATDPLANQTTYGYDAASQMTSVTDPLGNETTYGFDAAGQMTSVTDPLGNQTAYGFDDAGRRTSVTDPTDRTTSYDYDAAGELTSVTDSGGNSTESAYDLAGRLTSVTSPEGHVTGYAYDPRGLLTSVTDPLLNVTAHTYDDAGRLLSETDPTGAVTSYAYDDAGRLVSLTDDLGGVVTLGYDAASQLTSTTDPNGQTWTHAYNLLGLRTTITDPLDRVTAFAYDAAGQPTSRTDGRGITTSYGYDDAGQMTSSAFPGGSTSYAYDDAGRRTQMVDATGTTTFAYDDAGRTIQVASPQGTIGYGYDDAGRRASMTLPGSKTVTYGYNTAGWLGSLTDWRDETTTFGYDADGNQTLIARPNDVDSTYTYDAAGQVTDISHLHGAQQLLGFTYVFDDAGRPTSVTTEEGTESYTYDSLGRLTNVTYPDASTVAYTYDAAGNRLTETWGGSATDYDYDEAGQLVSVGSTDYTYDDAGNLIEAGSDTYNWDHDSRLLSAEIGAHDADYTYDGDGVRVGSVVDSASSSFLVDRRAGLSTVVDDGSSSYVHVGGLLEEVTGSQGTYSLKDRLGSIRGVTSDAGSLAGTASYEAFGEQRVVAGDQGLFGFTGEPTDATGLVYLRARSLDPTTGRMSSADTLFPNAPGTQGYDLYSYVANNPTTWTDPTGHLLSPEALARMAALGLLIAPAVPSLPAILIPGVAIAIAFLVVLCALWTGCLSDAIDFLDRIGEFGSEAFEGAFNQIIQELLDAADGFPETPAAEEPKPGDQPIPQPLPIPEDEDRRSCRQGPIDILARDRNHVNAQHTWSGLDSTGNSVFFDGVDWETLVHAAEHIPAIPQPGKPGSCVRVADAGVDIGVERFDDREPALPTSMYTVVTRRHDGTLITTFPGSPFIYV